jgi:uncharacterized membrane protein
LTLIAALGCGLIAGAFFAFSTFVDALASIAPADPRSAHLWNGYVASWTAWNHVRTAAALAATASFSIALSA